MKKFPYAKLLLTKKISNKKVGIYSCTFKVNPSKAEFATFKKLIKKNLRKDTDKLKNGTDVDIISSFVEVTAKPLTLLFIMRYEAKQNNDGTDVTAPTPPKGIAPKP